MYIKKSVLIIGAVILILVTAVLAIGAVNPFGFTAFDDLIQFTYVSRLIDRMYYQDVDAETYRNTALQGIAAATGDPYTGYLWGDEAEAYMENLEGNYHGVGLYIENHTEDNTITVVSAIAGTPAEEVGLTTGDKILKIDGETYTGQQLNEAANRMRGPEGSEVTLTVLRANDPETQEIKLVRREIEIQNVSGSMVTDRIGEITITQFTDGTAEHFAEIYTDLQKQGMQSLVIDLRNNPGGLIDEAVMVANMFIEDGHVIVYTMDKNENKEEYTATGEAAEIPIVLLTNGGSASASEILTGALKDYKKGYQIGEKTYGKGIVQSVFQMGDHGILSVTMARYYTPNGVCIHQEGIKPDLELPMDAEKYVRLTAIAPEEDEQLQAAVDYLSR